MTDRYKLYLGDIAIYAIYRPSSSIQVFAYILCYRSLNESYFEHSLPENNI